MEKQYKWKKLIEELGLTLTCPNCKTDMTKEFLDLVGQVHKLFAERSWTAPGNEERRKAQGRKMAEIAKCGKKGIKHKISEEVRAQRSRNINEYRRVRLDNRNKMLDDLTEHPEYVEHLRKNASGRQSARARKMWTYYRGFKEWNDGTPQLIYGTSGKNVFMTLTGTEALQKVFEAKKRFRNKQLYVSKYIIEDKPFYNISCYYIKQLVTLGWVKDLDIDGLYPGFDSNALYLKKKTGQDDISINSDELVQETEDASEDISTEETSEDTEENEVSDIQL